MQWKTLSLDMRKWQQKREGGREMHCVRTMVGISSATYFLIIFFVPVRPQLAGKPQASILWLSGTQTKPELLTKDLVFFCFRCAKSLSHSEATFALFFPFSPCQTFTSGSLLLLPNVMLLPCIRTPLNGQFDLLGDERGPCVAGGAYLRA